MLWHVTALVRRCWMCMLVTGQRRVNVLPRLSLQIFNEEYAVLYLDQGGALVAIRHTPLPIRHLWWVRAQPFVTRIISSEVTLIRQREISLLTKLLLIFSYKQQCINVSGVLSSLFFTLCHYFLSSISPNQCNYTKVILSLLFKAAYITTVLPASILRVLSNSIHSIFSCSWYIFF